MAWYDLAVEDYMSQQENMRDQGMSDAFSQNNGGTLFDMFGKLNAGTTATGANAFGTFMSVGSAWVQSKAAKSRFDFQSRMDAINAQSMENQARFEIEKGQKIEQSILSNAAKLKSKQRVGFAANGVDLGVGSAAEVLSDTDTLAKMDANQAKTNALLASFGFRNQAVEYRNRELMAKASSNAINPTMTLGLGILEGATSVASTWYNNKKKGLYGTTVGDLWNNRNK